MYARGIIDRLVTNIISTGLNLQCMPKEAMLGLPEDSLEEWTETIENRFNVYCSSKDICDYKKQRTWGEIQRCALTEAYIGGDILVILRQDPRTLLPTIELVPGERVRSSIVSAGITNRVIDGVELDEAGRHVAYYFDKGSLVDMANRYVRISARGELTGRLQAWLVYGADKREDSVRGTPLLGIAIQPLADIDKYKDSALRKSLINSLIAGFVTRENEVGTLPMQSSTSKKSTVTNTDAGTAKPLTMSEVLPGMWFDHLAPGEKPQPFSTNGTDVNFGPFEASIICGLAWGLGIPPEILILSFSSNYSASQAATTEFEVSLNTKKTSFGSQFCNPIYADWFQSELLLNKFTARGYLESLVDPKLYDIKAAWICCDWIGQVKPKIDIVKQVTGYKMQIAEGFCTRSQASLQSTGTDYAQNARRLRKENEQLIAALTPILEAQAKYGKAMVDEAMGGTVAHLKLVESMKEDDNVVDAANLDR
jgi:lambda family phage portal protein